MIHFFKFLFLRFCSNFNPRAIFVGSAFLALSIFGARSFAQTTTISGTVYDPRTTASALPLPNVLVYVTSGTVDPLPAGVQCLTSASAAPAGVVAYTNTAVDGSFTLTGVPVNATYTVVIQAGKWRRQFSETVADTPLTGLELHMPANHTQGDIPLIAITTGSADGLECVLLDMGIAPTEFTDDNGTTNPGGRIHLYKGAGSSGAVINASTPNQTALMGSTTSAALLNNYDMAMFPCQGSPYNQNNTELTNLLNYANAGGRVFTTHFSYVWLDPEKPYNSLFPPVANWAPEQNYPTPDPGQATVNTNFTDGATLAVWLENAGASTAKSPGQIQISTLRHDFNGVIPPTQSWLTLNDAADGNPVMQFTFNAPVGASAANQCGRVLFNEYHVYTESSSSGKIFPAECYGTGVMSPQEEMLEYALFDLSSFVTPVVVPTLSISFNPSPLVVKSGDSADQLAIDVTNTSSTAPVDSSVAITLALPAGLTATALTDSTGGWTCTLATLTCTRASILAANASDSITLTVSVPTYGPGGPVGPSAQISVTAASPNFSNNVTAADNVIFQQQPVITWATPAPITLGTALSSTQLDATASVAGTFAYSPPAGTILPIGSNTLMTTFAPTDSVDYINATATVSQLVNPGTPGITLTASPDPAFALNPVTFTATIAGFSAAPTGTVTFYDGATQIGSGTVANSAATFTTSSLAAGTHSITAVYSGDTNYKPVTSTVINQLMQDFTLTFSGGGTTGSANIPIGGRAAYVMVVTPVDGATLPGAISLAIAGIPFGTTSSFSPATVAAGSGATNVTLTVLTPGNAALKKPRNPAANNSLPLALGMLLLPFAARLRKTAKRWRQLLLLIVASAALAAGVSGCGFTAKSTTFTFTVTAASGPLSHTATVNMIVQ